MPIIAGLLQDRITFQRENADGVFIDVESMPPNTPALVQTLGDERYEFTVRYRADLLSLRDAQPAMRVLYRGRTLHVVDVIEVDWHVELRVIAQGVVVPAPDLAMPLRRIAP